MVKEALPKGEPTPPNLLGKEKPIKLNRIEQGAIVLIELTSAEDRPISQDEMANLLSDTKPEYVPRVFGRLMSGIGNKIKNVGLEIVDEGRSKKIGSPPKNSWRIREITQNSDNIKKIFDIDDKTQRRLKIIVANQLIVARLRNKIDLLPKSPEEIIWFDLDEINKKNKNPIRKHRELNAEEINTVKQFVLQSVEDPFDEYENASEADIGRLNPIQKQIRSVKLILINGTPIDKRKILTPIYKHFSS